MFSNDLKAKYVDSLANYENLQDTIKRTENFYYGMNLCMNLCTSMKPDSSTDNTAFFAYLFILIFIFFITIFILIFPYFIQLIPIIVAASSFKTENILVISICLFISILGIMTFLGARGCYVKWGCLYHPSNWALFVVLIDLVNLILDIICPVIIKSHFNSEQFDFIYTLYLHILAIFYNLYRQIMLYGVFKQAYKEIREVETDIIKRCIIKWAKDEKYL